MTTKYRNITRDEDGNKVHGGFLVDVETNEVIAYVDARSEADANKIEAASDLLEALEGIVADADRLEIYFTPDGPARRAIAKARGEA